MQAHNVVSIEIPDLYIRVILHGSHLHHVVEITYRNVVLFSNHHIDSNLKFKSNCYYTVLEDMNDVDLIDGICGYMGSNHPKQTDLRAFLLFILAYTKLPNSTSLDFLEGWFTYYRKQLPK